LFGRRDVVKSLTNALCARRSRLVVGPGKTRLLQESLCLAQQPYIYFERPDVLHPFLVELAERLACPAGRFKSIRNATSIALKPSVLEALRRLPRCLILENVAGADPRMYRFLQQVYYIPAVSLIVTAASRDCLGYLYKLLWDPREEIALKPLSRSEARGLFDVASRMGRLQSFDLDAFRTWRCARWPVARNTRTDSILSSCHYESIC
jgi:hypothetical protein